MTIDYGSSVSRTLQPDDRNFIDVIWNRGKPPLDSELTLMSDLRDVQIRRANSYLQSGVLNFRLAGFDQLYQGTTDLVFPSAFLGANEFIVQNFRAIVNGWVVDALDSSVNGGNFTQDGWLSIELATPPASGQRQDLLFLEVFRVIVRPNSIINKPAIDKIYKYGNTQYRGTQLTDDLLDPSVGLETTQRVQLQYKIRTVSGINFSTYPEGVDDPTTKARGPNAGDTAYTYTNQGSGLGDFGLYRAGNGDATSRSVLGTVDGYVYAIPILGIHRRNSTAYTAYTNPNGSAVSVGDSLKSDRPDGLFYDEINLKDIQDLRHLTLDSDCNLSEMTNLNFDQLLRGQNQNSWGNDYVGAQKGTKLLQVDAISATDQPGIYDFGIPNGSRRAFADRVVAQSYSCNITQGVNSTYAPGSVTLTHSMAPTPNTITIAAIAPNSIPSPAGLGTIPVLVWRTTGFAAAITGWDVAGLPGQISTTLDAGDPNYIAGGVIDITFYLNYEHTYGTAGAGMRHVPNQVYYVFNANPGGDERMGFSYFEYEKRTVGLFELDLAAFPVTGGQQDSVEDINPDPNHVNTFSTQRGTLRVYSGFMQGNGTATYGFPPDLAGFDIVGFYRFWNYTNPAAPVQIHPSSVTKTLGGFTVIFGQVFSTNQLIKYEAVLRLKSLTIERHSKGIVESYQAETLSRAGDGTNTYIVTSTSGIIVSVGTYVDLIATRYYAYVNGIRREIVVNSGIGTSTIRLTFPGVPPGIADQIVFEFVSTYPPDATDRIQIYYEFDPYQGLGLDIDNAVIKRIADRSLAHTIGTGGISWGHYAFILAQVGFTDIEIPAISPRLPLSGNRYDADLDLDNIAIINGAISTSLKRIDLYESNKQANPHYLRSTAAPLVTTYVATTYPYEGLKLRVTTPSGLYATPVPRRGVTDAWVVDKGTGQLDPYFLQYYNPSLAATVPSCAQYVHWMLISLPPENEIYMLIWTDTKTGSTQGPGLSDYSQTGNNAYDVYHVRYRPLLGRG